MQCARISLCLLLCAAGLAAGGRDQAEPRKCCIRVLLRGLRGGSGAPGAAGAGCAPSFSAPQPCADEAAPAGGAEEAPGFNGFVDNGVSYAQQFADQMQQRRQMGHSVAAPTPAMFAGEEGVSFDANGNFQLAPPGYTPEEAVEIMKQEAQMLADMSPEDWRALIQTGLDQNVRPNCFDPMNYVIQSGGFKSHPEHLEPALKMTEWSMEYLRDAGYTLDEDTLEWTPPKSQEQQAREVALRQQFQQMQAAQPPRPVLDLIDDTDPTDIARPVM